jgi:hypothetical protein
MKTKPLRIIPESPAGVGISAEFMNSIINRIEDLVLQAEFNKPIAGNNVQITYTNNGAIINVVTK